MKRNSESLNLFGVYTDMVSITRRSFIRAVGCTVLSVLSGSILPKRGFASPHYRQPLPLSALGIFSEAGLSRTLGKRYFRTYPKERDYDLLTNLVFGADMPSDAEALRQILASRCKIDFSCGNVVTIDGWIMARSEARACALSTLTATVPDDY